MIIGLEEILESGLFLTLEEPADRFSVLMEMKHNGDLTDIHAVKTILKAYRVKDLIEVEGTIETTLGLPCSRCLAPYSFCLKTDFAVTYTKHLPDYDDSYGEEGRELKAEEMGLIWFRGEKINLTDAVQEQIVLALPFRNLCGETCKGLCPHCGTNLNNGTCDCDAKQTDSRFAALKHLKF